MKVEEHYKNLRESLEVIEESIEVGLEKRQRTLAFHISAAIADMVEILLHKLQLIDPGFVIKHDYFVSERKAYEKIPWDFPKKDEIISLAVELERERNKLCYGKRRSEKELRKYLKKFLEFRRIFEELGVI